MKAHRREKGYLQIALVLFKNSGYLTILIVKSQRSAIIQTEFYLLISADNLFADLMFCFVLSCSDINQFD